MSSRGRLARGVLAVLPPVLLAFHRLDSADVWIHLATGRWIAAHRAVPSMDPFGAPPAAPWVVHDALAALGMHAVHAMAGARGLVLIATVLTAFAVVLPLALAWRERRTLWPFEIALLVTTVIAYERFFVRPELVTFVLTALFVQLLARAERLSAPRIVLLAAMQVVWVHSHAAFLLGPVLVATWSAASGWDAWRRRTSFRVRERLAPLAAVVAACFFPPLGPRLVAHALDAWRAVAGFDLRTGIVEWQPTFAAPVGGDTTLMAFVASLGAVAVAALRCRSQLRAFEVLVVVASVVLGCLARRHLALYALVVPPLAAMWVVRRAAAGNGRTEHTGRRRRAWLHALPAIVSAAVAVDVLRGSFYARFGPPRETGWGVARGVAPAGAADAVDALGLRGPVFNNVAAGSYMIWRLDDAVPPWVDGRLLRAARFRDYRDALGSPGAFDRLATTHGFRLVVLALQPFAPVALVRHLLADPDWRLVFLDDAGVVFAAEDVASARGIAAVSLDQALPAATAPVGSAGGLLRTCDPGAALRRGRLLLAFSRPEAARADLARALVLCPDRWDIGRDLGRAHAALGDAGAARPLLESAVERAPHDVESWAALAEVLARSGDRDAARQCLRRALALRPGDVALRRALDALGG